MGITCNQDCFNCVFDDCILTDDESDALLYQSKTYKTPEELRKKSIEYYWEHREERKAYAREHRKKYYHENKDKINEIARRRRELKKKGLI